MDFTKRFIILTLTVIMISATLVSVSSAVFSGDDRIVVVLDPGHGGKDGGAAGIQSEAYYNLQVALAAKAKLEANGNFIVYMTRSTPDKYLTLAERLYFADTVNADVVISMHFNSSASSGIGGVEVYSSVIDRFYLGTLGQMISSKVASAAGIQNRGVFRKYDYGSTLYYWSEEYQWDIPGDPSVGGISDYYGVITWGAKFGIPSLIVEHAYLSNQNERYLVEDPAILRAMGEADADALIEYYTNHTHSYGSEIIDAPVTCFSAGKKSVHCTVCNHRKNVTSVAAGPDSNRHLWLTDGTPTYATCESDGFAKYYCRYTHNLNDKGCTQFSVHYTESVVPAYGHDYELTFHRDVAHTVDGITTYTCKRCSASYSETVAAEGHSYSLTSHADPDCVNAGHNTYTCSVCNESYSDAIPALGHDFTVLERTDPTCTNAGSEHRLCNTCGFEENAVLPATSHDVVIYSDVMPTCTEEGLRITKCSVCGATEEETKPKVGHSFSVSAEIAPTCEKSGEQLNTCIVCSYEETVILDPLGHDFEILEEVPPTCDTDGSSSLKCRVCGKNETKVIPATGHSYVRTALIKAPGLIFDGKEECTCENDSSHTTVRAVRDLTIYEYMDIHPLRFKLMIIASAVLLITAAAAALFIILRKRMRPLHAKPKAAAAEVYGLDNTLIEKVNDPIELENSEKPNDAEEKEFEQPVK